MAYCARRHLFCLLSPVQLCSASGADSLHLIQDRHFQDCHAVFQWSSCQPWLNLLSFHWTRSSGLPCAPPNFSKCRFVLQDSIYFAYFPPYSYARHQELIARTHSKRNVRLEVLGETLDGYDLDVLRIGMHLMYTASFAPVSVCKLNSNFGPVTQVWGHAGWLWPGRVEVRSAHCVKQISPVISPAHTVSWGRLLSMTTLVCYWLPTTLLLASCCACQTWDEFTVRNCKPLNRKATQSNLLRFAKALLRLSKSAKIRERCWSKWISQSDAAFGRLDTATEKVQSNLHLCGAVHPSTEKRVVWKDHSDHFKTESMSAYLWQSCCLL